MKVCFWFFLEMEKRIMAVPGQATHGPCVNDVWRKSWEANHAKVPER